MQREPIGLADLLSGGGTRFESYGKSYVTRESASGNWDVYRVEGGLARQFGGSIDRAGAVRIALDDASGESLVRFERFQSQFDAATRSVRESVRAPVLAAGYEPWHTGGGCLAFARRLGDGTHLLLTTQDAGIDADPAASEWIVGRYGHDDGSVVIQEPTPLAEAIAAGEALPAPVDANGEPVEMAHDSLQDLSAALGQSEAAFEATKARMGHPEALKAIAVDHGGIVVEVALLGPGPISGEEWAVVTHQDCDPDHPERGSSGVEPYDSLAEAEEAWRDSVRGLGISSPRP